MAEGGAGDERASAGAFASEPEAAWNALRETLGAGTGGEIPHRCLDLCPICRGAELLRAAGPPELRDQIAELQRETLLTVKALIEHYLERLEQPGEPQERVEQIPID